MHLALFAGLVAAGGWLMTRPPEPKALLLTPEPAQQKQQEPPPEPTAPVSAHPLAERKDVERAARSLQMWVDGAYRRAKTPAVRLLGLEGLGKRQATRNNTPVAPLLRSWSKGAPHAPLGPGAAPELHPEHAVTLLLEGGWKLSDPLATVEGPVPLSAIVEAVWGVSQPSDDMALGRRLDFAALAAVSGFELERSALEKLTSRGVAILERGYRELSRSRGRGEIEPSEVKRLAKLKRNGKGLFGLPAEGLELTEAVFRSVMYLRTPEIREQGRRVLAGLTYRHRVDRALLAAALSEPKAELRALRVAALELDGRTLQALYSAHIALRARGQRGLPAGIVRVMRETAYDLLMSLQALQREGELRSTLERDAAFGRSEEAELRAAVHALRGLRVARAVTPRIVNPHAPKRRAPH